MQTTVICLRAVGLILATLASAGALSAQFRYRARMLDVAAPAEASNISVTALNNHGHVAGTYRDSGTGTIGGFLFDGTQFIKLEVGSLGTGPVIEVNGLSNDDRVVGTFIQAFVQAQGVQHAFLWQAGEMQDLGALLDAPGNSTASAVNGHGHVSGTRLITNASDPSGWHPFVFDGMRATEFGVGARANDLNDADQVVGGGILSNSHAVLWADGVSRDLGTIGGMEGARSAALAINDSAVVVGWSETPDEGNLENPFVWSAGRMVDLGRSLVPSRYAVLGAATAVNNYGVVVGDLRWGSPLSPGEIDFDPPFNVITLFVWFGGEMFSLNGVTDFSGTDLNGVFSVQAINDQGEILATGLTDTAEPVSCLLEPITSGSPPRLVNISVRAPTHTGEATTILGFVLSSPSGGAPGRMLLRAVGPGLEQWNVTGFAPDPRLVLFSGSHAISENNNWGSASTSPDVVAAFTQAGAFALADNSTDAAEVAWLAPGGFTVHTTAANNVDGVALSEVYHVGDSDPATAPPDAVPAQMVNGSARVFVGTGDGIGILGFVLLGDRPARVLIRAVGPSLVDFGVQDVLADPQLWLFRGEKPLLGNNDWGAAAGSPLLASTMTKAGAFPLPDGSKDAALLVQLDPGAYTVHVSGADGTTGVALIELYMVSEP